MIRAIFGETLLFLLPFALFALYLIVRRRNPLDRTQWGKQVSWLVVAGLGLAVLALIVTGFFDSGEKGGFVPTHMENGRVVPGQFR